MLEITARPISTGHATERLAHSADEAAFLLHISRSQIYALMATGELRSVRIGRSRRIPHEALTDYLESLAA